MNILIPYNVDPNNGAYYESYERRLHISFTQDNNILILDEYKNSKGDWVFGRYAAELDFPINVLSELIESLQRVKKLLILK
jgi:hypothetical protein